jgi:hypothetical protein
MMIGVWEQVLQEVVTFGDSDKPCKIISMWVDGAFLGGGILQQLVLEVVALGFLSFLMKKRRPSTSCWLAKENQKVVN